MRVVKNQLKQKRIPIKRLGIFCLSGLLLLYIGWFFSRMPSNDRNWIDEFSVQPRVSISENTVTIQNARDWSYTSDGVSERQYQTRVFDVTTLTRLWLVVEPFGSWDGIAHTYFIFDFADQEPIAFSIEARREHGETYGALIGTQRQFELIYLWGSERDFLIGRSLMKKNTQVMYPIDASDHFIQNLFLTLASSTEELYHKPRFYNTFTSNCTNNLADFANTVQPSTIPWHYARYLTGFSGKLVYDLGYLPAEDTFEATRDRYTITSFVPEHAADPRFSQLLRDYLLHDARE